jgi:hypothetical protein
MPMKKPETAMDWDIGAQIKCLEDGAVGTVSEIGYATLKIKWENGVTTMIGRQDDVAGRFERVC